MWRCNQVYSGFLFAFGAGVLLGSLIESGFLCTLLILAALGLGCVTMGRRH